MSRPDQSDIADELLPQAEILDSIEERVDLKGAAGKYPAFKHLWIQVGYNQQQRAYDVKCTNCSRVIKYGKLDRLIQHNIRCSIDAAKAEELRRGYLAKLERLAQNKSTTSARLSSQVSHNESIKRIVKLLAQESIALSLTESKSFRELIAHFQPSFRVPSRYKFRTQFIPELAIELYNKNIERLSRANDFSLTIEFDAWQSASGMGVLGVIITEQSGQSTVMDLIDISNMTHSGRNMADTAIDIIQILPIESRKLNAIITDEASNMKLARSLICQQEGLEHLIEYRCLAHVINLIGAELSRSYDVRPVVQNLMDLIPHLTRKQMINSAISRAGANRVVRPVPTRWYSLCASINSIIDLQDLLQELVLDESCDSSSWGHIVRTEFFVELKNLKIYFDKLSSIIGVSETDNCYLADSMRSLLEYGHFIFIQVSHSQKYVFSARASFVKHFAKLNLPLMFTAYALQPQHAQEWMTKLAHEKLQETLGKLFFDGLNDEEQDLDQLHVRLSNQYDTYRDFLKRRPEIGIVNLYDWWRKSAQFLYLKPVGLRLATCHASSANTERVFSHLAKIMGPSRNRINIQMAMDLLTIKFGARESKLKSKFKNLASAPELSEEEAGSDEVAGFASEISLHESLSGEFSDELDDIGLSGDLYLLESMSEYVEFTSWVDYRGVPSPAAPLPEGPNPPAKRSSQQKGQDYAAQRKLQKAGLGS